ncbi:MAG: DsrE family protein [Bosea sp. (in: a-proteobacteria)]
MSRLKTAGFILGLTGLLVGGGWIAASQANFSRTANPEITQMHFQPYAPQKVIYHVTEGGGLLDRGYKNLLQIARNHVDAVGKDWLDLRIVLQGDGAGLLMSARKNPELAKRIDELKRDGVRIVICHSTLTQRRIDPDTKMYNLARSDIVQTALGETTALVQQGFVYLKPIH